MCVCHAELTPHICGTIIHNIILNTVNGKQQNGLPFIVTKEPFGFDFVGCTVYYTVMDKFKCSYQVHAHTKQKIR